MTLSIRKSAFVLVATLLGNLSSARAAPGPVGLDDCYVAALKRSELIAGQAEGIVQAEERIKQAYGSVLPSIGFSAGRTWLDSGDKGSSAGSSLFPLTQNLVKFTATQPLFQGLRDFAALSQSKHLEKASREDLRQAEVQLYKDLAQAFYTVLSVERDYQNINSEISFDHKRVKELRERIRIGRSRISESLTVESQVASLLAQADAVRGQIAVAREALAFQTGLAADIPLQDIAQGSPKVEPIGYYLDRTELRPDVLGNLTRVDAAEKAVSVASGAHLPTVALSGNYYLARTGALEGSSWDAQLLLTLPIFSGGVTQSQVRTAASQQTQAELILNRTRRLAADELRSAYSTVLAEQTQLQSLQNATRLAERNYTEQSREYRLGLVTNIDVLQALTTFQETKRAADRQVFALENDLAHLDAAALIRPAHLLSEAHEASAAK